VCKGEDESKLEPIRYVTHCNPGCRLIIVKRHPNAITLKAVSRPLARGGEVELVIVRFALYGNKRLKAGVLPEVIRFARRSRRRDSETRQICLENIVKDKRVVLRPARTCFDFSHGLAG